MAPLSSSSLRRRLGNSPVLSRLTVWSPLLTQIGALSRPELDELIGRWTGRLGFRGLRPWRAFPRPATYQGLFGRLPLALPLRVQVYQRRNRLQAHHVQAFVGQLVRAGIPLGLLVTTGGVTDAARETARCSTTPRVLLYSGDEWARDLARRRIAVRRRTLWQWLLERGKRTG